MSQILTINNCLEEIKKRYNNNEKIRRKLANYEEPIQVSFMDTNRKILILINKDQGIEIKDKTGDDTAKVKIEFTGEEVMINLFNKKLGAVKAYSDGKVKIIEGNIRTLMKLRSLMF
ncbi:MAG: SCP2 sterol-binding domain-containing protein [Promethearchaeota archaeon]